MTMDKYPNLQPDTRPPGQPLTGCAFVRFCLTAQMGPDEVMDCLAPDRRPTVQAVREAIDQFSAESYTGPSLSFLARLQEWSYRTSQKSAADAIAAQIDALCTTPTPQPAAHETWAVYPTDSPTITRENHFDTLYIASGPSHPSIASTKGMHANATPEERARFHRIVACVNACAGIPDPEAALRAAREALNGAALTFVRYALLHNAKRTPEAEEKAYANLAEYHKCHAALALLGPDTAQDCPACAGTEAGHSEFCPKGIVDSGQLAEKFANCENCDKEIIEGDKFFTTEDDVYLCEECHAALAAERQETR